MIELKDFLEKLKDIKYLSNSNSKDTDYMKVT
jgi:hypothetical protein